MLQITARRYSRIIVIALGHQLKRRIIQETCISYFGYVMQSAIWYVISILQLEKDSKQVSWLILHHWQVTFC